MFQPICPLTFFRCFMPNLETHTLYWITVPILLKMTKYKFYCIFIDILTCSRDWTCNLLMISLQSIFQPNTLSTVPYPVRQMLGEKKVFQKCCFSPFSIPPKFMAHSSEILKLVCRMRISDWISFHLDFLAIIQSNNGRTSDTLNNLKKKKNKSKISMM